MKTKTSELQGKALDYAVAKAKLSISGIFSESDMVYWASVNTPSNNWGSAGPIIEREKITIEPFKGGNKWSAFMFSTGDCEIAADTPLIAAMRCYVASKLGDIVEVPDELIQG